MCQVGSVSCWPGLGHLAAFGHKGKRSLWLRKGDSFLHPASVQWSPGLSFWRQVSVRNQVCAERDPANQKAGPGGEGRVCRLQEQALGGGEDRTLHEIFGAQAPILALPLTWCMTLCTSWPLSAHQRLH